MLDKRDAVRGPELLLAVVDRLAAAGSEAVFLDELQDSLAGFLHATCAVATRVTAQGDDALLTLAHRALIEAAVARDDGAVAIVGGESALPALAVAVHPAPGDAELAEAMRIVHVAARLLPGVRAQERELAHIVGDGLPATATARQQVTSLLDAAARRGRHVVVGMIAPAADSTLVPEEVVRESRRLAARLRRMLRFEDRVWAEDGRVIAAQVLPQPDVGLLGTRMAAAVRSVHAEQGRSRRPVDMWVTGRPGDGDVLAHAEWGLARLAAMRRAAVRCLAGDPDAFAELADVPEAFAVVDEHRTVVGLSPLAASLLERVGAPDASDPGDFRFFHPDGSPMADEEMPGRQAVRTGISTQDRVLGIQARDSRVYWGLVHAAGVQDPQSDAFCFVLGMAPLVASPLTTRVRDAMDLTRDAMVLMSPVGQASQEFRVDALNTSALTLLRGRERDLVGAAETDIYPFDTRFGLVLDYARVARTRTGNRRVVSVSKGSRTGSFEISAMPWRRGVLVVAHNVADGHPRADAAHLWDPLTGLSSRHALLEHLHALDEAGRLPVTLVLCDIDDFTGVNDSLGRRRSDRFLMEVGRILSGVAGPDDVVARIGSDEFGVLTCALQSPGQAEEFAEMIRQRLKRGVRLGEDRFTAACSVGVAWTAAGADIAELLPVADAALAESKAVGDTVTLGHRDRRTPAMRAVAMEAGLREALEARQFRLLYQPLIDLRTGQVLGAEALIRWEHPTRGTIGPTEFIAVAERRHLITPIGEWVIEQACQQLARWRQSLGYTPRVALNTSLGQLVRPGLARTIRTRAADAGIDPQFLQLEVTESQLLLADSAAIDHLLQCRDAGCEIAIDDFGTGHAGFDYLRRIPAQVLKVDKTFIDGVAGDPTDRAILAGVVAVGHGLGLSVVAEGVETAEQMHALQEVGCDAGQGWVWSPAVGPDDLERFVRARNVSG